MGKKLYKRMLFLVLALLIFGLSLPSINYARDNLQSLKGFFSSVITIFNNNKQINLGYDDKTGEAYRPLVINNRTYIPVRAISEVLDKEVTWTQATNRIDIVDRPDRDYEYMLQELEERQRKIEELEEKIRRLESRLESKRELITNLNDMGDYLNDQYYTHKNIRFYIYLSGDTDDINVKIFVDSRDDAKWVELTNSEIEEFIGDIVGDIQDNFKNAYVTGYIESDYTGKKAVDFYLSSRGNLEVDISNIQDLNDMADYLNSKFRKFQGMDFHVKLYWDLDKIRVDVFVLDTDWIDLGGSNREKYLKDIIYKEINSEFPFEGIYGYIFDDYFPEPYTNYVIQNFEFDYNGKLTLD